MSSRARRISIRQGIDGFLGGCPPIGVEPTIEEAKYFLTVRVENRWLSLFVCGDYDALTKPFYDRVLLCPQTIELIEHSGELRRSASECFRLELSSHTLGLGPELPDSELQADWATRSKVGGEAQFDGPPPEKLLEYLRRGFTHTLQIGFAGSPQEEPVDGSWPFGPWKVSFFRKQANPGGPSWLIAARR